MDFNQSTWASAHAAIKKESHVAYQGQILTFATKMCRIPLASSQSRVRANIAIGILVLLVVAGIAYASSGSKTSASTDVENGRNKGTVSKGFFGYLGIFLMVYGALFVGVMVLFFVALFTSGGNILGHN